MLAQPLSYRLTTGLSTGARLTYCVLQFMSRFFLSRKTFPPVQFGVWGLVQCGVPDAFNKQFFCVCVCVCVCVCCTLMAWHGMAVRRCTHPDWERSPGRCGCAVVRTTQPCVWVVRGHGPEFRPQGP